MSYLIFALFLFYSFILNVLSHVCNFLFFNSSFYLLFFTVFYFIRNKSCHLFEQKLGGSHTVLVQHSITVGSGSDTKLARLFQT